MFRLSQTSSEVWGLKWIWLLAVCFNSSLLLAQHPILRKADSLALAGDARGALHELDRAAFYLGSLEEEYQSLKAKAHFALGEYVESMSVWSQLATNAPTSAASDSAWFCAATAAYMLGDYAKCIDHLNRFSPPERDAENYLNATVMKAMALNGLGQFAESKQALASMMKGNSARLHTLDSLYAKPLKMRPFHKGVPLALSLLLPGSGQAYAGKPLDGLISLALTGGSASLGVYAFTQGHYLFTFMTCLVLFEKFYEGGARHAIRLAQQRHENKRVSTVKSLNGFLMDEWLDLQP